MKKYYQKFSGIKKTGGQCKTADCKKDLIVTDIAISNGEQICQDCYTARQRKLKRNSNEEKQSN